MEEWRKEHHDELLKLVKAIEYQNVMFGQLLSFLNPIAEFFRAMQLVVKVFLWIAAAIGIVWGSVQAVKEYMKTHS